MKLKRTTYTFEEAMKIASTIDDVVKFTKRDDSWEVVNGKGNFSVFPDAIYEIDVPTSHGTFTRYTVTNVVDKYSKTYSLDKLEHDENLVEDISELVRNFYPSNIIRVNFILESHNFPAKEFCKINGIEKSKLTFSEAAEYFQYKMDCGRILSIKAAHKHTDYFSLQCVEATGELVTFIMPRNCYQMEDPTVDYDIYRILKLRDSVGIFDADMPSVVSAQLTVDAARVAPKASYNDYFVLRVKGTKSED